MEKTRPTPCSAAWYGRCTQNTHPSICIPASHSPQAEHRNMILLQRACRLMQRYIAAMTIRRLDHKQAVPYALSASSCTDQCICVMPNLCTAGGPAMIQFCFHPRQGVQRQMLHAHSRMRRAGDQARVSTQIRKSFW